MLNYLLLTGYNLIVPCLYDSIKFLKNCFWVEIKKDEFNSLCGIYSINGEQISECIYDDFPNPIVKKTVNGVPMYGIMDDNSKEIIKCDKQLIYQFYEGNMEPTFPKLFIIQDSNSYYIYNIDKGLNKVPYQEICSPKTCPRLLGNIFFAKRALNTNEYNKNIFNVVDVYDGENIILTYMSDRCILTEHVYNSLFICKSVKSGKYGLIDKNGIRTPFIYDKLTYKEQVSCFPNIDGKIIVGTRNSESDGIETNKMVYDIYTFRGSIIADGLIKFHIQYHNFLYFLHSDFLYILDDNGNIINKSEDKYDYVGNFGVWSHTLKVGKDKLFGEVDEWGNIIVPCKFKNDEDIEEYKEYTREENVHNNSSLVSKCRLPYSPINKNLIIKQIIDKNIKIVEDIFTKKIGIIDNFGNEITDIKYVNIGPFNEDQIAICETDLGQGIINIDGEEILPCQYEILSKDYKGVSYIYNKYIKVKKDDKYGIVDVSGNIIVPCIYPDFSNDIYDIHRFCKLGYLRLNNENKVGLIKLSEPDNYRLECKYDEIRILYNNCIGITPDNKYFLVRRNGFCALFSVTYNKFILQFDKEFTDIKLIYYDAILGLYKGKYCSFSISKQDIVPDSIFDKITEKHYLNAESMKNIQSPHDIKFTNGNYDFIAKVEKDSHYGIFDFTLNKMLIPCDFEEIGFIKYGNVPVGGINLMNIYM